MMWNGQDLCPYCMQFKPTHPLILVTEEKGSVVYGHATMCEECKKGMYTLIHKGMPSVFLVQAKEGSYFARRIREDLTKLMERGQKASSSREEETK